MGTDLISRVATEDDLPDTGSVAVLATRLLNRLTTPALFGCTKVDRLIGADVDPLRQKGVQILAAYRYPLVQTFQGMCCSPLVVLNGSRKGKIVGLHCAGDMRRHGGYAAPLVQSDLEEFRSAAGQPAFEMKEIPLSSQLSQNGILLHGLTLPGYAQVQSVRSSIRPSPIFNQYSVTTRAPACLKITHGIDPLVKGQAKMLGDTYSMSADSLQEIGQFMVNSLRSRLTREGLQMPRRLSIMEAIRGTERCHEDSLVLKTSAGFPFNVMKPGGKEAWFTRGENNQVEALDPMLRARIDKINEEVEAGIIPVVVFRDT